MNTFTKYEDFLLEKLWQKEVSSSHLTEIEYDSTTEELTVTFTNGDRYKYYEVPKSIFGKDIEEGTYGKKFWELIRRGNYKYEKL